MGLYLEPANKEQWLQSQGIALTAEQFASELPITEEGILVCLVEDGPFFAAGVMYSAHEHRYWVESAERDTRSRRYFRVPIEKAKSVCPGWDNYMKEV